VVNQLWKRLFAVGMLAGSCLVAVQTPAMARDLYPPPERYQAVSVTDSSSSKSVDAVCPPYMSVLGGGGAVWDYDAHQVMLTELRPVFAGQDYFHVTAVEPAGGFAGTWTLAAYAICGSARSPILVSSSVAAQPAQFEIAKVGCGSGRHAVGAGGAVSGAAGRVGLQLVRPTGDLLGGWASGRADSTVGLAPWSVTAYLVCAVNYPLSSRYVGHVENRSEAWTDCPGGGTYVFGTGGGARTVDSGPFYLQSIVPTGDLISMETSMTGTPTGGGIVSVATCGFP
jgi:hypothetical protein